MYSDQEAKEGETARIIVTDLFNKAITLIRYNTADTGVYEIMTDGRKILTSLLCRKLDFLYTKTGKTLSPFTVTILIRDLNNITGNIKQFQFIQESLTDFTLKMVYSEPGPHTLSAEILTKDIKNIFGQDSTVSIEELDDIPREPSGKRKYIVSRFNQAISN